MNDVLFMVILSYAILTLIGGGIGFLKAGSRASLIAGAVSGLLLAVSAYGIREGSRGFVFLAAAVALALGLRFFKTWKVKKRLMPDLMMVILSVLSLLFCVLYLLS